VTIELPGAKAATCSMSIAASPIWSWAGVPVPPSTSTRLTGVVMP
jgi:hypothetical protein